MDTHLYPNYYGTFSPLAIQVSIQVPLQVPVHPSQEPSQPIQPLLHKTQPDENSETLHKTGCFPVIKTETFSNRASLIRMVTPPSIIAPYYANCSIILLAPISDASNSFSGIPGS